MSIAALIALALVSLDTPLVHAMQDEVVQTRPAMAAADTAGPSALPQTGEGPATERQDCVFGGQPVACPGAEVTIAETTQEEDPFEGFWLAPDESDQESDARYAVPPPPDWNRQAQPRQDEAEAAVSTDQNGCRTETRRSADGASVSTSFVCGSGDSRMLDDMFDSMRERSEPPGCARPVQGDDKAGFLARCGGNPY